jgi:hypothetical protein
MDMNKKGYGPVKTIQPVQTPGLLDRMRAGGMAHMQRGRERGQMMMDRGGQRMDNMQNRLRAMFLRRRGNQGVVP